MVRTWCVLYILTSKCASRHNGVHFFNISTSKSGPDLVSFVHFDFEMCFAPQWRAIFHLSSGQLASLFYSPLLSASAQLSFSSVHIVGSLTSKLPSINHHNLSMFAVLRCAEVLPLTHHNLALWNDSCGSV